MVDDARDRLLDGLYALVQRAVEESAAAEDPVPQSGLTGARRTEPPAFPIDGPLPGVAQPGGAANAIGPPGEVRFRTR